MYSIQGIKPVGNSLPRGLKTILKKGGHNYSSILDKWTELVGKNISSVAFPKSIKSGKELKNGTLFLNVNHGDQLTVEYQKKNIIDKINSFFGYNFIKEVRLVLIKKKSEKEKKIGVNNKNSIILKNKIENIDSHFLRKNLKNLIDTFKKKGEY